MNENESRAAQNLSGAGSSPTPSAPIPKGPRLGIILAVIVLMAVAFVVGAVLTPSTDPFTQTLLATHPEISSVVK